MPAPGTAVTRQRYKVVVLGAPSAGKTALVRRLADGSFMEGARPRGLDFYTCHVTLRDDVAVALQLWDLSDCPCSPGDDHAPLAAYIFNSQAVLFVYDVSCPASLDSLRYALRAVEAAAATAGGARPYFALVANKADLQWAASEALARELAARHGCVRFALSARSGQGVSRAAVQLAADLAGVPLAAATEHSGRFMEPELEGGSPLMLGLEPDCTDPATAEPGAHGPGRAPPAAAAAVASGPDAYVAKPPLGLAATALQQWQAGASGKFQARAPAYQTTPAQSPPLQASTPGSLDELGMYGMSIGGGGGSGSGAGEPPWRPISRSTTPSRAAATIITRTGPLGQRNGSGSPPPPSPPLAEASRQGSVRAEGPARGAGAAAGASAVSERSGTRVQSEGELRRRGRSGWRRLLCCWPAQQQQQRRW